MATTQHQSAEHASTEVVRFHLSLNVDDLARSVEFFSVLFDLQPAKLRDDYAKFELAEPPLVLSLVPNRAPRAGKLNHLGFRLANSKALVALQLRLEMHGVRTQREDGVECCYARQTKFWVTDPDGNSWEMYTLDEDIEDCGQDRASRTPEAVASIGPAPAIWAHRLGEPFPAIIMADAGSVDEVILEGSFNAALNGKEHQAMLAQARRVLKPGGKLTLHQLSADTTLERLSRPLPGPASVVERVPSAEELVRELEAAGFRDFAFEKRGERPCFVVDGVDCRETRLVGFKPSEAVCER